VFLLVRVNRTYEAEDEDLLEGMERISESDRRRHRVIVVVDDMDEKSLHALQYALTAGPKELHAVHLDTDPVKTSALRTAWARAALRFPLDVARCSGSERGDCLKEYVSARCSAEVETTVILPAEGAGGLWDRLRNGRQWSSLLEPLRGLDTVSVAVIRDHGGRGHVAGGGRLSLWPRGRHVVLILVDRLDRSVVKAIRYARAVDATEVMALHAAVDVPQAQSLLSQWAELGPSIGVPLQIVECTDRNIARAAGEAVARLSGRDTEVTVVLPRRDYPHRSQRLLHDRTSHTIARALADRPHVDVVTVPYRLGRHDG
jgi:hypothetical protein